jgi:hypothetical protein
MAKQAKTAFGKKAKGRETGTHINHRVTGGVLKGYNIHDANGEYVLDSEGALPLYFENMHEAIAARNTLDSGGKV